MLLTSISPFPTIFSTLDLSKTNLLNSATFIMLPASAKSLNLYNTVPTFNDLPPPPYEASIFSFPYNIFYSAQNKLQFYRCI